MRAYRRIAIITAALAPVNFLLFGVKLYIGLASNSVAIYSDGVNNLLDALSLTVTAAALFLSLGKTTSLLSAVERTETLFTFLISLVVTGTGFVFLYNALERFLYPAPVWYTAGYLAVLIASVGVKLLLFFLLRRLDRGHGTGVLRAVGTDSLTDALITAMTVLTLLLSSVGGVSFDAIFGMVIGVIVTVSGVRHVVSSGRLLTDSLGEKKRTALEALLTEKLPSAPERVVLSRRAGETLCFVFVPAIPQNAHSLQTEAYENTGVTVKFIVGPEKEDSL